MEIQYVNLIISGFNLVLFICQVAAIRYLLDLIGRVSYNEKRSVEELAKARAREEEAMRDKEAYKDRLKMLDNAERIAALINNKEA